MNTTAHFFSNRIALTSTLALSFCLSACKTETTSTPSTLSSSFSSSEKQQKQKKKKRGLFEKKPGNAVDDFKKDLAAGRIKLKQYGVPGKITPFYNKILEDDLGIKTEVIADGLIAPDMLRYAKEYNALMTIEIERTYGSGILQKAFYRAQAMEQLVRSGGYSR